MAALNFRDMTLGEIQEFAEGLYEENQELRAKTANRPKLETWEVRRIRDLWDRGVRTQAELAHMFDVNEATVSRIVRRIYYRNL